MADMTLLGSTGLSHSNGVVQEEYLRELQGPRWRQVVREMTEDPTIGAVLFAIEMLIRQVDWSVAPCSDDPAAADAATFVDEALHDMQLSWPEMLAEMLSMLPWGWAYFELVYKVRDGQSADPTRRSRYTDRKIGWRTWGIRAQETLARWEFDASGAVLGMWQVAPPSYQARFIPAEKAMHLKTTSRKGNPEGRGIIRTAYRSWYFKTRIENIEGVGIERNLAGLPVAFVPPELLDANATPAQKQMLAELINIVTNIRRDEQEGIIFPMVYDDQGHLEYDLKLLSTGGTRQFDTNEIIGRYNTQIAMSMLADFLFLGHEKVGSFALSSDKTDLFATALGAWLATISAACEGAFRTLLELNGMDVALTPKLQHSDIESLDLTVLATYIATLTKARLITPDAPLEAWLREQAGMPIADPTTAVPHPTTTAAPAAPTE